MSQKSSLEAHSTWTHCTFGVPTVRHDWHNTLRTSYSSVRQLYTPMSSEFLVHGQVAIIFVVSVCLSVCLFVCLFVQSFSAVFDPISIKLGHILYVWV